MEKKLPNVFANKIEKEFHNNEKVFYSKEQSQENDRLERTTTLNSKIDHHQNINQKIYAIFNSPRYVYKADVIITTKSATLEKRIIGKTGNHLITIDNELIPISEITDIRFK